MWIKPTRGGGKSDARRPSVRANYLLSKFPSTAAMHVQCTLYFCVIEFCISGLGTGWSLYWLSGRSSQPRLDFLHKRLRPRRRPSITWCNLAEMIFVFLYSLFCISALFICLCNRDFLSWSPFCAYSQKLIMSEICTVTLSSAEQIQNTRHSKLKKLHRSTVWCPPHNKDRQCVG